MFEDFKKVFFLGIGGIGMSALARWFYHQAKEVGGYDRVSSPLTESIANLGLYITYEDNERSIPSQFKHKEDTLIVYTPAIPSEHTQKNFFLDAGFTMYKRSEILGIISKHEKVVAVAGTHGKTSTSSMLTHLFQDTGIPCTSFLGGIAYNFGTNLVLPETKHELMVMEADEYDKSFLRLYPHTAIITSVEADHLDVYGTEEELSRTFQAFVKQVSHTLITHSKYKETL